MRIEEVTVAVEEVWGVPVDLGRASLRPENDVPARTTGGRGVPASRLRAPLRWVAELDISSGTPVLPLVTGGLHCGRDRQHAVRCDDVVFLPVRCGLHYGPQFTKPGTFYGQGVPAGQRRPPMRPERESREFPPRGLGVPAVHDGLHCGGGPTYPLIQTTLGRSRRSAAGSIAAT